MDKEELEALKSQISGLSEEEKAVLGLEFELGKETRKLVWWWIVLPFVFVGVAAIVAYLHISGLLDKWLLGWLGVLVLPVGMAAAAGASVGTGMAASGVAGAAGSVAGSYASYEATRYRTDRELKWEKYKAEQARAAQEFAATEARLARERAAKYGYQGQVRSAELGMRGQVRSAKYGYSGDIGSEIVRGGAGIHQTGMQVGGNVVVAGFGQFNASQRMGTQWAYRSNDPREVAKRFLVASVVFIGGMFVLALALDWFGFPILKNLIDLVVETVSNGIARMNVIESLAEAGDVEGAKAWMTSAGGTVAGGFIGVCQRFFEGIMSFFAKAGAAIANALGSVGSAVSGAIG